MMVVCACHNIYIKPIYFVIIIPTIPSYSSSLRVSSSQPPCQILLYLVRGCQYNTKFSDPPLLGLLWFLVVQRTAKQNNKYNSVCNNRVAFKMTVVNHRQFFVARAAATVVIHQKNFMWCVRASCTKEWEANTALPNITQNKNCYYNNNNNNNSSLAKRDKLSSSMCRTLTQVVATLAIPREIRTTSCSFIIV